MTYDAMILSLDSNIEELVEISVNGNRLTCFASVCPYEIEVENKYPVECHVRIFDDLRFELVEGADPECIDLIDGFHYSIIGKLREGKFVSKGIEFVEDDDFSEIAYLDGQTLKIDVDRLEVHFL
jgi:hypothetical protein